MTDPRKLAEDALRLHPAGPQYDGLTTHDLARELLKALNERDAHRDAWQKTADRCRAAEAKRDEALRSIGEETKLYIEELEAERDDLRKAYAIRSKLAHKAEDELQAERDRLREALEKIVKKAKDAWDDVDDLDDTGAHVGLAKYERTKADGLSIASDIARAALEEKKS
jgi:hypothetical protein